MDQVNMPSNCAEHYRAFLLYLLREELHASGPYDIRDRGAISTDNRTSLTRAGLYFLFWSAFENSDDIDRQDQIYPLYVGITGRSFKQRFIEHYDNGVVRKIIGGQWPRQHPLVNLQGIVAYYIDVRLPVAKFLESVFLYTFDFAMNKQENDGEREFDAFTKPYTVEQGWADFKEGYGEMRNALTEADGVVSTFEKGNGIMSLHHYRF